jgi:hypothetical protein
LRAALRGQSSVSPYLRVGIGTPNIRGRFFTFWARCVREAFWGNSAFANDWQWVVGNPLSAVLGGLLATYLGATALSTGSNILDAFFAALAAFIITWLVAFLIRLFSGLAVERALHLRRGICEILSTVQ